MLKASHVSSNHAEPLGAKHYKIKLYFFSVGEIESLGFFPWVFVFSKEMDDGEKLGEFCVASRRFLLRSSFFAWVSEAGVKAWWRGLSNNQKKQFVSRW